MSSDICNIFNPVGSDNNSDIQIKKALGIIAALQTCPTIILTVPLYFLFLLIKLCTTQIQK